MIHLESSYDIPTHVIHAEIGDGISMINLDTKKGYVLNPSGVGIWKWLQHGASVKAILTIMADSMPIDGRELATQVTSFIDDLVEEGLITQRDSIANKSSLSFSNADNRAYAPPSVQIWDGVRRVHEPVK
jgi:Coenzyme PQQ synthesis protein D (PqqD)